MRNACCATAGCSSCCATTGVACCASPRSRARAARPCSRAGLQVDGLQTLLLVDGDRIWQQTAAILRVLHALGWPWRLAWAAWVVPAPLRDALYRVLARHRYRWFGRSETCLMPPADHAQRFLD